MQYTVSKKDFRPVKDNIGYSVGILTFFGLVVACVQAWGWNKRQGQVTIDCFTLLKFALNWFNNMANAFFVVTFGMAMYYWIFFKVSAPCAGFVLRVYATG